MRPNTTVTLATKWDDKYSKGGAVICGIEWGGSPAEEPVKEEASFFSDTSVNNWPYRNNILKIFSGAGNDLALKTQKGEEGPYERSISQTNWLPGQARDTGSRKVKNEALEPANVDRLFYIMEKIQPKILMLMSRDLQDAFDYLTNQKPKDERIDRWFGKPLDDAIQWSESAGASRKVLFGQRRYEKCRVYGFTHPTPQGRSLSDENFMAMGKMMTEGLMEYKAKTQG